MLAGGVLVKAAAVPTPQISFHQGFPDHLHSIVLHRSSKRVCVGFRKIQGLVNECEVSL